MHLGDGCAGDREISRNRVDKLTKGVRTTKNDLIAARIALRAVKAGVDGDDTVFGFAGIRPGLVDKGRIPLGIHFGSGITDTGPGKGRGGLADKLAIGIEQQQRIRGPDKGIIRGQDHRCEARIRIRHRININDR